MEPIRVLGIQYQFPLPTRIQQIFVGARRFFFSHQLRVETSHHHKMITSSPITFLSIAAEGICRKRLLAAGLDNLLDVAMHESSGSCGYLVVKIKKRSDED